MQSSAHQSQPSISQGQQTSSHGPASTGQSQPERASKGYTSSPLSAAATAEKRANAATCLFVKFFHSHKQAHGKSDDYCVTVGLGTVVAVLQKIRLQWWWRQEIRDFRAERRSINESLL
ncbi:unnamed protein product [Merluccius merluccius]